MNTIESGEFRKRVGARLLERKLVSEPELARANRMAEERKMAPEQALVALGQLTEDQVGVVMAEELGIPYVLPYANGIDPALVQRFPAELLRRHHAVPVLAEGETVNLAAFDPAAFAYKRDFEIACGKRVAFSLASRRHVERVLAAFFGKPAAAETERGLDDLGAVNLFYGHLARALQAKATELRFEPADGSMSVRYRIAGRLEDRGREPLSSLVALAARARALVGICKGAKSYDTVGTLNAAWRGTELTLDVALLPTRAGESVLIRMVAKETKPAGPAPAADAVPAQAAAPAPALKLDVATLLEFTKESGGSDLHLSAGASPMIRVHGEMRKLSFPDGTEAPPLAGEDVRAMVFDVLNDVQKARLEANQELDLALQLGPSARFRGNVFFQDRGLGGVFRVIPTVIKSCDELGLPPVIKGLAELEKGLVLCTGPTGSGKSTTLAAVIDLVNQSRRGHILTVEDPIEFVHQPKQCMVNQREVGRNTKAFANALRSALREDPDVILVGEMRDLETIALAITAAETGHLVFGTLHTSSAAKTVDRIINVFPAGEQGQIRAMLAESLQAVIAQVLLQKKGGKGRVAAQEILMASTGVRSLIREGKTYQLPSAIQTGAKYGMQSLEQALAKLATNGLVEASEAERQLSALGLSREDAAEQKMAAAAAAPAVRPAVNGAPVSATRRF
jgi:twitching motility protein PilT